MYSPLRIAHPHISAAEPQQLKISIPRAILVAGAEATIDMLPVAQSIASRFPQQKERPLLVALVHGRAEQLRAR